MQRYILIPVKGHNDMNGGNYVFIKASCRNTQNQKLTHCRANRTVNIPPFYRSNGQIQKRNFKKMYKWNVYYC